MKNNSNLFNRRIDDAIIFAAEAHKNQFRKTDPSFPYISHPIGVGFILRDAGFSEDVVIAGILHDVMEDCGKTEKEIRNVFGARVAFLVRKVSENKKDSWEKRKENYLKVISGSSAEVKAISTADKLHNIRSIIRSLEEKRNIWKFFKKDKRTTVESYAHFTDVLKKNWRHPLLRELEIAVKYLKKEAGVK